MKLPDFEIKQMASVLSRNEHTIYRYIKELRSDGKLTRIGTDKNGYWHILKICVPHGQAHLDAPSKLSLLRLKLNKPTPMPDFHKHLNHNSDFTLHPASGNFLPLGAIGGTSNLHSKNQTRINNDMVRP